MQNDTYYLHLKLIDFNNHVLIFYICKMAICKRFASFSTMQCVLIIEQYKTGLKIKVIEQRSLAAAENTIPPPPPLIIIISKIK